MGLRGRLGFPRTSRYAGRTQRGRTIGYDDRCTSVISSCHSVELGSPRAANQSDFRCGKTVPLRLADPGGDATRFVDQGDAFFFEVIADAIALGPIFRLLCHGPLLDQRFDFCI